MLDWLRRRREKPAPLTGAPAVRRLKTYSAQSGYVYQYFYEGQRAAPEATEFVFSASADRKKYVTVSVFVSSEAVETWEKARDHVLHATERYAVAKMALFQAFDEREQPDQMTQAVHVRYADLDLILETLGLD
jgi:hypothetical protein